jgi:hypothetical protein
LVSSRTRFSGHFRVTLPPDADNSPERTGVFTSGLVQERRIALFFTGCKHAGENLAEVRKQRPTDLPPPIQMCDALSRNVPKAFATLLANCLTHYPDSGVIQSWARRGALATIGAVKG